jgi:hypothetical protein
MSQQPLRPMIDPVTGLPIDPGIDPRMGFPASPPTAQPNFMSKIQSALGGPQGMMNMGASLLAGSGPSPVRQNFGSILGQSLLQNQQFQQQQGDSELKKALLMSQIERNKRGTSTVKTPSKVQEYEYAKQNGFEGSFQEWMRVGSAQAQVPADIQSFNDFMSRPPEEQQKWIDFKRNSQPYQVVDVAGGRQLLNKSTGDLAGVSTAEQEATGAAQLAGATAGGKTAGEAAATAKLDLPRLEQNTTQALQTIGQLKKHPGLPYITGAYSVAPIVPGTPQAGADALAKQIQGKTFLEAFTTLKGGGAITEIEGGKAEAAIARLQRSQNRREYIQALTELEGVMNVGLERARKKANAGAAPRSREDILKQYGVQ